MIQIFTRTLFIFILQCKYVIYPKYFYVSQYSIVLILYFLYVTSYITNHNHNRTFFKVCTMTATVCVSTMYSFHVLKVT